MNVKTIEVSDAGAALMTYARSKKKGPLRYVVTWRGKPLAAITDIDEEMARLSTNPKFIAIIERSRRSLREEGGVSSEEVRRMLGIPRRRAKAGKPRRRATPRKS